VDAVISSCLDTARSASRGNRRPERAGGNRYRGVLRCRSTAPRAHGSMPGTCLPAVVS